MREIPLTKGYVALVDDEDFERVNAYKWCAHVTSRGTKVYAVRWARLSEKERWRSEHIRLHNFVLDLAPHELPPGHVIDHCNHNGLDCRKTIDGKIQLEIVTQDINMYRSPGWKRKVPEPCL